MGVPKPLSLGPELAKLLREAAATGLSMTVTLDDRTYRLSITPETDTVAEDL